MTPHRTVTFSQIDKTVDYFREMTPSAKFGLNPSIGGFIANVQNVTIFFSYFDKLFLSILSNLKPTMLAPFRKVREKSFLNKFSGLDDILVQYVFLALGKIIIKNPFVNITYKCYAFMSLQ